MGLYSDRFSILIKGQDIECSLFSSSPSPPLCTKDSSRVSADPMRGRLPAREEESPRCDLSMPVIQPGPPDSRTVEREHLLPETPCAAQAAPTTGAHTQAQMCGHHYRHSSHRRGDNMGLLNLPFSTNDGKR